MRLRDLQERLHKIELDVGSLAADGRIEAADITWMEQVVASLDEVVSGALPTTRVVRTRKFLGVEITLWGRKVPKPPK
jgi:hypothetical protein